MRSLIKNTRERRIAYRAALGILSATVLSLCTGLPANAQSDTPQTTSDSQPWIHAEALLRATDADVRAGGVRAVESHVADLEQALIEGKRTLAPPGSGATTILTDGSAETLLMMITAATRKTDASSNHGSVQAIHNPYPMISLYLGSYYNEVGKHEDALRVLDEGLALRADTKSDLGEHLPFQYSERGAALMALHRWEDALADYDEGLRIGKMADENRARLLRGRGYALTELSRLDEAEQAYNDSLRLTPGNPLALNELKYIARLRAGGPKAPAGQLTIPAPTGNPQ